MKIKEIKNGYGNKKNAMKNLHDAFGIDWNKPYTEIYHKGRFTVNSLKKELAEHGNSVDDSLVLAMGHNTDAYSDTFSTVIITKKGFENEVPPCLHGYWKKGAFNDARKQDSCEAIFFAQKKEYLTASAYKKASWVYGGYDLVEKKASPYGRFKDICSARSACQFYDVVLDNSGYCVTQYQHDLHHRFKAYKDEKNKAEYLKTDNTDKIVLLESLIEEFKVKLSKAFLDVKTAEEVYTLSRYVDSWDIGLAGIMSDYQNFRKMTLEKSFGSIEESNRCYDSCAKRLHSYLAV